jgi:hypothetical protein
MHGGKGCAHLFADRAAVEGTLIEIPDSGGFIFRARRASAVDVLFEPRGISGRHRLRHVAASRTGLAISEHKRVWQSVSADLRFLVICGDSGLREPIQS